MLAALPCDHSRLRSSINENLSDIIELHDDILREIRRVVSDSQILQTSIRVEESSHLPISICAPTFEDDNGLGDTLLNGKAHAPSCSSNQGVLAGLQSVAEVSKIFNRRV